MKADRLVLALVLVLVVAPSLFAQEHKSSAGIVVNTGYDGTLPFTQWFDAAPVTATGISLWWTPNIGGEDQQSSAADRLAWHQAMTAHLNALHHDGRLDDYSIKANWWSFVLDASGQLFDGAITVHNIGKGCTEANTMVYGGPTPSAGRVYGTKVLVIAMTESARWVLHKLHAHAAADTLGFAIGGVGFGAGIYNMTLNCSR